MDVRECLTADGKNPYREWLDTLDVTRARRSHGRCTRRINAVARRSEDWNVGLAKDLRDAAFAREFLLASIDEGVDLQLALGKVIRAMGVKEFATKVRMASPNVLRAINPRHNPTQDTLNRLLKPFKLRLSLAPLTGKPRRTAA